MAVFVGDVGVVADDGQRAGDGYHQRNDVVVRCHGACPSSIGSCPVTCPWRRGPRTGRCRSR